MNELTIELNELAKNSHEEKEVITEEDLIKALYYLDNLYIGDELAVLIYLSALNLCNSYAKQVKNHDVYKFKKDIATLINIINDKQIPNVYICRTVDNGPLYIFKISNMQFSFHDSKEVAINANYYKEMTWDGIRKQPCAKTLFEKVTSNSLADNTITKTGEPIKENIQKLLELYHNKSITFEEIINEM